jgi:hypothetical protein
MFPDAKKFLGDNRLMELGVEARKQQLRKAPASRSASSNRPGAHAVK